MIRRLAACAAALALGAVSVAPAVLTAQEQPTPQEAFIAELADIRQMPADRLLYDGALALARNECWWAAQGVPPASVDTARIRDAAQRWICPEVTRG